MNTQQEKSKSKIKNAAQASCKSMLGKNKKRGVAFDIPGFHESVKRDYENGEITLEQAAMEFYKNNWTMYVDYEYTKKKLGITE